MSRPNTSWDDYHTVLAVAETGSLAGAAQRLGVNQSTIFRRLGALEDRLGLRLFDRQRTGYVLTPAGEDMHRLARGLADNINDFERRLSGLDQRPQGDLRIATNDSLAVHLLPPILADFRRAYPGIRLELLVGNEAHNLARRDADIALRATSDPPESLFGRKLGRITMGVYAAESMGPVTREDYRHHDWVVFTEIATPRVRRWVAEHIGEDRIVWRINTMMGIAEAVAAGGGLGLLPRFVGEQTSGLRLVSEELTDHQVHLWILTHPDLKTATRVRLFMDFVGKEVARIFQRRGC